MSTVTEYIKVVLEMTTEKFQKGAKMAKESLSTFSKETKRFGNVMKMPMDTFRRAVPVLKNFNSKGANLAIGLRKLTHGMRGFRMEMLGVMFFGQAVSQTFANMLQPAMDAFGVFDLWNDLLLITFVPIMEKLMPLFLQLFDAVSSLPEPVQLLIGVFAVAGLVIGKLVSTVGMLFLGIGSLIQAFPALGGVIVAIGGVIGTLLIVLGVLAAAALIIYWAWKDNFGKIRDWIAVIVAGIKQFFTGLKQFLQGDIVEGIKNMFGGLFKVLLGLLVTLSLAIANVLIKIAKGFIKAGVDFVEYMIQGVTEKGSAFINKIKDLAKSAWNSVKSVFGVGGGSSSSSSSKSSSPKKFNDMVWRPGSAPVSVSPQDTLVAFKKNMPGSGGANVSLNPTYNIYVNDSAMIKRVLEDNNRKLFEDVRRMVNTR